MIISTRLDVLELKRGDNYLKLFKGLDKFLECEDKNKIYTQTYCEEFNMDDPVYIVLYKNTKDGAEILYESANCKIKKQALINEAKDILTEFLIHIHQKVVYGK